MGQLDWVIFTEHLGYHNEERESKLMSLEEAIRQNVRPGMKLHIAGDPNAALRQIIRQFWGKQPRFTLITSGVRGSYAMSLIYLGLVKKLITSFCSIRYPVPGPPVRVASMTSEQQNIEIESWSILSLEQRLMAAALGFNFMPTKSIAGSSMESENRESFKAVNDPFGEGKISVVKAIAPDLCIIHACAANSYGDSILPLPYRDMIWGPRASKNGVIVTAERIVPTPFIRQHSHLVKLPGYLVKAVCPAPLGAHPQGLINQALAGFESYEIDYPFMEDYRKVAKSLDSLKVWIGEWVLNCTSDEDYLRVLGEPRISLLKRKAGNWKSGLSSSAKQLVGVGIHNQTEMMIIVAAREIKRKMLNSGYRTLLSGTGSGGLSASLAYFWLVKEGYTLDLAEGLGTFGYVPTPGWNFGVGAAQTGTAKMLTDTTEVYGVMVAGAQAGCLSVLGAMQIDRFGNVNSSRVGDLYFGSGGLNDATNANEALVVMKPSRERLVEKVDYITSPGKNVKALVTTLGIFEKLEGEDELILTAYFKDQKFAGAEEKERQIQEHCGWALKIAANLREEEAPRPDELELLRLLDPECHFIREKA